jgi:hypothetical protein
MRDGLIDGTYRKGVCQEPVWDWDYNDYRIRPEPFRGWVNIYAGDKVGDYGYVYPEKDLALQAKARNCLRTIEVVEVVK